MQIKDLSPNPKNPRTITDEKLAQLKKALLKFGDLSGIIFNKKTRRLAGGHQRLKHLEPDAPITIVKKYSRPTKTGTVAEGFVLMKGERFAYREVYWDENREKAANLAANKGAGEWDLPQLSTWLKDLSVPDLDFDLGLTMFDEDELKEYGGIEVSAHTRSETTGVDEDEVPEKAPARTKLGDIYQLGQHRLLCGDSTDLGTVEKLMDGQKADMVFTDPPYGMRLNVDYDDMFKNDASKIVFTGKRFKKVEGDDKDYDPNPIFSIIADDYFIWGADYFYDKLPSKGSWTAWDKRTNENMDKVVGNTTEFCWSKNPHRRMTARVLWSGHHGMQKDDTKTRVHPTQKPVALVEWFFNQYANKHKSIVDIYGGSGSTLIACEKTNRKCFMMELDPHYCDVIVERWEKYTGRKATLVTAPKTVIKKRK